MKALIELRYIRDYHPEAVNRKVIDEAIEELEALENKSCSTCRYESVSGFDFPCDSCKWVNQADRWEAKDD